MKKGELVLLLSKNETYLTEVSDKVLHTQSGVIRVKDLKKKKFGDEMKTHIGKKFRIVRPNLSDILSKKMKRLPQIMMPKDVGLILAYVGIDQKSVVVDAGTGSGFLAIMLAHYLKSGRIITYEKNKKFAKIARENIKLSQLKNVKLKTQNIMKIKERNVDLMTIDMENSEKLIKRLKNNLKIGGWLVVFSPYIEKAISIINEMKKNGFVQIRILENIVREWQSEKLTRPKTSGILHTGFLVFGRRFA